MWSFARTTVTLSVPSLDMPKSSNPTLSPNLQFRLPVRTDRTGLASATGTDAAADQHDGRCIARVVLGDETPAEHGLDANEVEGVRGNETARIRLRQLGARADDHRAGLDGRHPGKRATGGRPVVKVLKRHASSAAARVARVDPHDPIGPVKRQASQQDRVDKREHCTVGANPERERGNRCQREPAIFDEATKREADILSES